jgi:hypothetical protein
MTTMSIPKLATPTAYNAGGGTGGTVDWRGNSAIPYTAGKAYIPLDMSRTLLTDEGRHWLERARVPPNEAIAITSNEPENRDTAAVALAPELDTVDEQPSREQVRQRLLAAGLLVTKKRVPDNTLPLTTEQRLQLGTSRPGSRTIQEILDEDRGL